ncbi:unnamed protein product [Paramecium sonneborni]|uniref:Uncharacterized protein n=1 Tax=Paramecium sonneborni TaxID=65129 RepID=A0A8S1PGX7_9CILI|nr:unnamed protein product [Paramecium sonneborni]
MEKISRYQFLTSFGVNYQNTYMVAGSDQQIFVFQFKEGIIKQMKILWNHKDYILTLNFFKWNQIFISGSRDGSFILWSINLLQNGKYLLKVSAHSGFINCIALPKSTENFVISGSNDSTIKIWSSYNNSFSQFSCSQKITEHSQCVFGLSINNSGNQFLSCGKDGLILVIEKCLSQNWILKQRIQYLGFGYRISYLSDLIFSFQPTFPQPNNYLLIYQLDPRTQLYVQVQQLLVKGGGQGCTTNFPMLYNSFQNVLLDKNGTYLNIISFDREQEYNYQFNLENIINFNTDTFYGTMSLNGEYLITWDTKSVLIQIRKYISRK